MVVGGFEGGLRGGWVKFERGLRGGLVKLGEMWVIGGWNSCERGV